jgi:hypothetical protein
VPLENRRAEAAFVSLDADVHYFSKPCKAPVEIFVIDHIEKTPTAN